MRIGDLGTRNKTHEKIPFSQGFSWPLPFLDGISPHR